MTPKTTRHVGPSIRPQSHVAASLGITRGGVAMAEKKTLRKFRDRLIADPAIRAELERLGYKGTNQ